MGRLETMLEWLVEEHPFSTAMATVALGIVGIRFVCLLMIGGL